MSGKYNKTNGKNSGRKNNQKYNKGNQGNAKPSSQDSKAHCTVDSQTPRSNDPKWWNRSVTFSDAVRVPFNVIPGYTYEADRFINTNIPDLAEPTFGDLNWNSAINNERGLPGLATVGYIPCMGPAENWNDPVNKSWLSIYSSYASKTAGTLTFQQADLAIIGEATHSIIVLVGELKRALGVANLFSNLNQYLPKHLLVSLGFDPDSIIGHQDDIRRELNYIIGAFNSLNLPGYTDLHLRRYQLARNIYADEDSIRAAFTSFVTEGYYVYTDIPDDVSDSEYLKWVPFQTTVKDFSDGNHRSANEYIDALYEQLNALRNSSAFAMISAAALRAFGTAQLLQLEYTNIDEITIPVPDRMMTYQIQNADFVGYPSNLHVTSDIVGNALLFNPKFKESDMSPEAYVETLAVLDSRFKFINSFDGTTDEDFVIESTRLKLSSMDPEDGEWNPSYGINVNVGGTEICTHYVVYRVERVEDALSMRGFWFKSYNWIGTVAQYRDFFESLNELTKINNHPFVNAIFYSGSVNSSLFGPYGDVYHYTAMDRTALQGLHDTALQSIYTLNPTLDIRDK